MLREQVKQRVFDAISNELIDIKIILDESRLAKECGSKIIYLKKITDKSLLKNTDLLDEKLRELPSAKSKKLETIKLPDNPTLNYKEISENEVRIKFSETHTKIKPNFSEIDYDKRIMGFTEAPQTSVIVFSVNRKNGNAILYFDTPWEKHPYPNDDGRFPEQAYFNNYLSIFNDVFGTNESINLCEDIHNLILLEPQVCKPRISSDTNSANSRRTIRNENLYADNEYMQMIKDPKFVKLYNFNSFNFLKKMSSDSLLDDVNVNIHPFDGIIKIPAERLSSEVEYVISTIRKI